MLAWVYFTFTILDITGLNQIRSNWDMMVIRFTLVSVLCAVSFYLVHGLNHFAEKCGTTRSHTSHKYSPSLPPDQPPPSPNTTPIPVFWIFGSHIVTSGAQYMILLVVYSGRLPILCMVYSGAFGSLITKLWTRLSAIVITRVRVKRLLIDYYWSRRFMSTKY